MVLVATVISNLLREFLTFSGTYFNPKDLLKFADLLQKPEANGRLYFVGAEYAKSAVSTLEVLTLFLKKSNHLLRGLSCLVLGLLIKLLQPIVESLPELLLLYQVEAESENRILEGNFPWTKSKVRNCVVNL